MDLLIRSGRLHRPGRCLLTSILLCAVLAGCTEPAPLLDVLPLDPAVEAGEHDAGVLPRSVPVATRRLLPNETSLPGENYILRLPSARSGRPMSLAKILQASGPLPHPFEYAINRDFVPVEGGVNGLSYLAAQPVDGVTCVLVAGTSGEGHAASSPMLMRNCVRGDTAAALAPAIPL